MRGKAGRVVIAAAVIAVGALVASFVGGGTAPTARAADPGLGPQVIHPAGFGEFRGDIRHIPRGNLVRSEERPEPRTPLDTLPASSGASDPAVQTQAGTSTATTTPGSFAGLDEAGWGAGWPPDPNADVGPNYVVETVNTSIGIFNKSDGSRAGAFTFDSLFSQAATGTPCDNSNQGDPVALYDPFGDRYIVSDFAWSNFSSGPFYQCFAVSKNGDPVNGGWYFYAYQVETGSNLPDYPKLGVWPDGIYMSANVFASSGSGSFQHVQVWAFDREKLEAGIRASAVSFSLAKTIGGVSVFSLLPSNARAVTGSPPAGSPNYFASIYGSYAIRVWKFHVDWTTPTNSTFTGPTNVGIATFSVGPSTVAERDGNALDTLSYRLMMQNQYTNLGGRESLWLTHTVGNGSSAAVRWYELPVTGGTISAVRQQSTYAPDGVNRFMPSLAVDKSGNMAIGYSVSDASMYPAIRYSGRLATDALSKLTQAEQTIVQGQGFQCCTFSDGSTNTRWGDYSSMTIDPSDGCTFWYTGEYYDAHPTTKSEDDWLTRIGHFQLPGCSSTSTTTPSVTSVSPISGPIGTGVTITGSNLNLVTGVTFNGTTANITSRTTTTIQTAVPTGASTGPLTLAYNGGNVDAGTFTVTSTSTAPTITSFNPPSGKVTTPVVITGTNFTGATSVTFGGGATASFHVDSVTQITATVPSNAKNGPLTVTTPNGSATSSQSFRVTKR